MKDLTVFAFLLHESLGGWSEVSGARTRPPCCCTMRSLNLVICGGSIYVLGRMTKGTKRNRVKGSWAPSFTEGSWMQHSDTLSGVPFIRIEFCGRSSWKGRLGSLFTGPYAQQKILSLWQKERTDTGQQPAVAGTATKPVASVILFKK